MCFCLCQMLGQQTKLWMWIVLREKATHHALDMSAANVSGMLSGKG